ncbi:hypothetical protein UPYG_G00066060 [Umbra pygmaea]|uniref:Uncharacterized protein n=1 Tax=Umbra pygmaea TaxID=75934 RepID=A0ABD0XV69_UMBPY
MCVSCSSDSVSCSAEELGLSEEVLWLRWLPLGKDVLCRVFLSVLHRTEHYKKQLTSLRNITLGLPSRVFDLVT